MANTPISVEEWREGGGREGGRDKTRWNLDGGVFERHRGAYIRKTVGFVAF
ncbi:hypothetical protein IF1G_09028 [Cordyceps javanica]|uniref:Uncharacterized protein n=1 Tax=Cordyceps javanica TaxID=43265 RepID=A0A545UST4_9HYPO|nr:hypothetical protein IF1G_09028 [Cordyceps javanica]